MDFNSVILWGFAATLVLTSLLVLCRNLHLTRMDIPFLLGTIITGDRIALNGPAFCFTSCLVLYLPLFTFGPLRRQD